jgi:hypothetical protein
MNATNDRLSLDELALVLNCVIVFREKERTVGRKFAERGSYYDRSHFVHNLVSKGFLEKGSEESHWSDYCFYRPTQKAMEEIDAALEFINLRMPPNACNA